jgi:chorismate mutase
MKGTSRDRSGAAVAAVVATVTLALFWGTVLSAGLARAAELPPELRDKVVHELSDPTVRDQVLENLSKSLNDGLPADTLALLVDRTVESGISPSTLEHLTGTLARAVAEELPPGPIVAKVLEGVAKNVPEDRLVLAVDRVTERLKFAAEVARLANSKGDDRSRFVVRTADAVAAGMDRKRLRSLAVEMSGKINSNKVSSLQIMEMVKTASGYGVPPDKVERVAKALINDENADEGDIERILRSLVEHDNDRDGPWDGGEEDDDGEDGDDGDGDGEDGDVEDGDVEDGDDEDGDGEDGDGEDEADDGSEDPEDGDEPEDGDDSEDGEEPEDSEESDDSEEPEDHG